MEKSIHTQTGTIDYRDSAYLPYTNRRYRIFEDGELYDYKEDRVVPYEVVDGVPYVEIDWYRGVGKYDLGMIVLTALERVILPDHLYDEIESLFVDGDPTNFSYNNHIYRFRNGPLEVEGFEGYCYIPFASRYAINKEGHCISLLSLDPITWTKTVQQGTRLGGYAYRKVVPDSGFTPQLYRHRAIMLAFTRYDANVVNLTVNHKNGIKGDDWFDNLEWATYAENNQHARMAGLCIGTSKPVLVYDYRARIERRFNSIAEAERAYPYVPKGRFKWWVNNPPKRIPECDLYIKFATDNTPWPEWKLGEDRRVEDTDGRGILAINKETNERHVFPSVTAAANALGISWITVRRHCDRRAVPTKQPWCFRYADDIAAMPDFDVNKLVPKKKRVFNVPLER